ncbi:MAG: fibronectin type III domain-containing protein, partial [Planctomycetes bacterium]|nr:fibronectin type III domain-containing protein [Planctomycetota bacterium]
MQTGRLMVAACAGIAVLVLHQASLAAGKIKGSAGGIERGASVISRDGTLRGWTVTGPSGLYEFTGLQAGEYLMLINGIIVPNVRVLDGRTTVVDQADQPELSFEQELWTPGRVSFAQSFVATGTAVTGFSLWRASGDGPLRVSLYEDSPTGKRVAGPVETGPMTWICWTGLPADQFVTTPGRKYALELAAADGKPWNHSTPRRGDVYPDGIAWFDGVAHTETDLGIAIFEQHPGLRRIAEAGNDLHYIPTGPGSGTCTVAGQTFIANAPNLVRANANCGFNDAAQHFIFTIHEGGPDGAQVGPACRTRMVPNWGTEAMWFSDAVSLKPGRQYYLQYRRADGKPFFSYLSSNEYKEGRAYRDNKMLDERFDQLFGIDGEEEPGGVIYPHNVKATDITGTTARITWESGTAGDGLVHYGTTRQLAGVTGSREERRATHSVELKGLQPGTLYLYRASSDTYKRSSLRMYSRIYSLMTLPVGNDRPRYDRPLAGAEPPRCEDCLAIVNPGFEEGTRGWTRLARAGRPREPERYRPQCEPFGDAVEGTDGYLPHSGRRLYGWSCFGRDDPAWTEPREDWKREITYQRIAVQPDREYVLKAWILTGDRGSGWGRDSRVRLAVDERDAGLLERFDT